MYIFVMYGNVGPSWNEKRIAQAIVGHICFVDVQGTPGHRCVCLVCAYYVAVCPLAAAAMAANDREWLCNIYPPTHNSQAILIMREYRNLQPQPHYIPNLDRFVNPTTKTDRDRPPQLFSKKCKITQTREK